MGSLFFENRLVFETNSEKPADVKTAPATAKETEADKQKREQKITRSHKAKRAELSSAVNEIAFSGRTQEYLKAAESMSVEDKEKLRQKSMNSSVYALQSGGVFRYIIENEKEPAKKKSLEEKYKLEGNQGYKLMLAQFTDIKKDEQNRTYLYIKFYGNNKAYWNVGLGHMLPPEVEEVTVINTDGSTHKGKRGIKGKMVGYFEANGNYIEIFDGYKVYLGTEQTEKQALAMASTEQKFFEDEKGRIETEEKQSYQSNYKPDAPTQELINRGSTPFPVRIGYQLLPDQVSWYKAERKESHRIAGLNFNDRRRILDQKYRLYEGMEKAAKMLNIPKKDMSFFLAYNDALLRVESNYNPFDMNLNSNYQVHLSTAAGEYQILNESYREVQKKWLGANRNVALTKKYNVNLDEIKEVDFNAPRPELLTPYQRAIFHNFYAFFYSRMKIKNVEPLDSCFDKIRSTDGRRRDSWIKIMYTYWRNGHGGASALVRNLRNNIPLPKTEAEAKDYFNNYLQDSDWQKKRGFKDFWMLMRVCNVFAARFNKNLSELNVNI